MQRTALIIGATGLVGNSLLTQLGSLYQKVIIIARSQPKGLSDSMHFYQLKDFNQMHEFVSALSIGKDTDAFSCLGTTIKEAGSEAAFRQIDFTYNVAFAKACKQKGVERFFCYRRWAPMLTVAFFITVSKVSLRRRLAI